MVSRHHLCAVQAQHPADIEWRHLREHLEVKSLSAANDVDEYHQLLQVSGLGSFWARMPVLAMCTAEQMILPVGQQPFLGPCKPSTW